jgi:hypothetical protein
VRDTERRVGSKRKAAPAAGDHLVYMWTLDGTHAATGNAVRVAGWEDRDLDPSGLITLSHGWFDAADYARQTAPTPGGCGGLT